MKVSKKEDGGIKSDNPKTTACAWDCEPLVAAVQATQQCTDEKAVTLVYLYFLVFYAVYKDITKMKEEDRQHQAAYVIPDSIHQVWVLHQNLQSYNYDWGMYCNHPAFPSAMPKVGVSVGFVAVEDYAQWQASFQRYTIPLFKRFYEEDLPMDFSREEMIVSITFATGRNR